VIKVNRVGGVIYYNDFLHYINIRCIREKCTYLKIVLFRFYMYINRFLFNTKNTFLSLCFIFYRLFKNNNLNIQNSITYKSKDENR